MDDLPQFRFCPVCGAPLHPVRLKGEEPLRLVCDGCRYVLYLDPKVAACSIIELNGGIVLLKRSIQPEKGKWVFPGGFVDRGEKVEEAALRETMEECGLKTEIEGLLGVYSYPGQTVVVVVYRARHLSGLLKAGDETREAQSFPMDRIPWEDLAFRSTTDALHDYLQGTKQGEKKI
jgi:ADP-ribose pyrophosphatase YjhB (NUDIX family)